MCHDVFVDKTRRLFKKINSIKQATHISRSIIFWVMPSGIVVQLIAGTGTIPCRTLYQSTNVVFLYFIKLCQDKQVYNFSFNSIC